MPLTDREIALAQALDIPPNLLERAKTMLELIQTMSYFSTDERMLLLKGIIEIEDIDYAPFLEHPAKDIAQASVKWNLRQEQLIHILNKLGANTLSAQLPHLLEDITGFAPTKVEYSEPILPPVFEMPPVTSISSQNHFQRMDIILCQHDPTTGIYQYTLLLSGHHHRRSYPTPPAEHALAELVSIPTNWGQIDINNIMCTATPYPKKHPDEDDIIADLIRQHGPFDVLFKLALNCDVPIPSIRETEIQLNDTDIRLFRHQSIQARGLSIQHNSRVELDWPESTTLELPTGEDPRLLNASITKTQRQVSDRHQSRGSVMLHLSQIYGETVEEAHVQCSFLKSTESRLQGVGGVGTIISAEVAQLYSGHTSDGQIYHSEPLPENITWSPFLGPTSGRMHIDDGFDLFNLAVRNKQKHRPIQHKTAPMRVSETHPLTHSTEKHKLPFALCLNSAAELESKIKASDWALANRAQQLAQAQQHGELQINLHIAEGYGLCISCQPRLQLEEVIDGQSTTVEHPELALTYENKALKQPEHVNIKAYSPDFERSWNVESRCYRQIWSLTKSSQIRVHQPSWLDNSGEWSADQLNHHIRTGWAYSGWWISEL